MISVNSAIQEAIRTKQTPAFQARDIRDLAIKLGMPFPVSIRDLLGVLNKLPPAVAVFSSDPIEANYVRGGAQLGIGSDGLYSFRGNLHENGEIGDNYFVAVALLDVHDSSGKTFVAGHDGWLAGQLAFGDSDDSFQDDRFSQLLKDQWDAAKNSRVQFILHVSTNPLQLTETFVASLFVVVGVVLGGIFAGKADWQAPGTNPDGSWHGWRVEWNRGGDPGITDPSSPITPGEQSPQIPE
jgi:hypothetical protein